jgi:hypothetical protein
MKSIVWKDIREPTTATLRSTCEQPWDVENTVVLNKCLLNSQGMETKTSGVLGRHRIIRISIPLRVMMVAYSRGCRRMHDVLSLNICT